MPAPAMVALAAGLFVVTSPLQAQQPRGITLATTTSTHDTGLLDSLLPMFERETGIAVKAIAVGTGAALEMARRGDVDAVLVHAPASERAYVRSGSLVDGRRVMYNDFLVLGPVEDPAGARGKRSLAEAIRAIAARGSFVSRGDGSGTEKKELELWRAAGVAAASLAKREETGQGMSATLLIANERQTYVLADRATYLAFRDRITLVPVIQGDPVLRNIYSVYAVNPGKHRAVRRTDALRLIRYLTDPSVQAWIGEFGRERWGEPLFHPDAGVHAGR